MIRVHVTPRKALFDPSLWKTNQASLRYALLSKLRGGRVSELIPALSEGVEVRSLEDSLHEQKPCPNVGLWIGRSRFEKHNNFKPAVGPSIESCELPVDACSRCLLSMEDEEGRLEHGVPAHASWTVPELRTLLMEARSAQEHPSKKEADVMKGLTKCSLPELIKMATDQGITLPAKPTRGWLLLNLCQSKSTPAETIVPFGKFKDLERLATWGEMELKRRETKDLPSKSLVQDPEALAKILPPDLKELRGQNSDSSWSRVGGYTTRPRASSRRLRDDVMAVDTRDSGAEDDEITMLKTRLAVLEERKASKADVVTITGVKTAPRSSWRMLPVTSLPTPVELVRGLRDPERMGATLMRKNLRLSMSSVVRRPIPRLMTSWILGRRPLLAFAVGRDWTALRRPRSRIMWRSSTVFWWHVLWPSPMLLLRRWLIRSLMSLRSSLRPRIWWTVVDVK